MASVHVFFLRGLSTYGKDRAKWSVFDFGPVYQHLERAFRMRDIEFHPVLGMGAGSLPEVAARAVTFLDQHPVWRNPTAAVHLLGHSAGGLVARMLASQPRAGGLLSCVTLATPNNGAGLAQAVLDMPEKHRRSALMLQCMGYNVGKRRGFFSELTPAAVAKAMRGLAPTEAKHASVVCSAPRTEWCLPLQTLYKFSPFAEFTAPSDGMIERDSQAFGDVIGEIKIDHFREVGLFGEPQRFAKMCDLISDFFKRQQRQA